MTDKAIQEGFAHLKDAREYDNLYHAAVSRAEADWLVGINCTRALTCKYNAQLSCEVSLDRSKDQQCQNIFERKKRIHSKESTRGQFEAYKSR